VIIYTLEKRCNKNIIFLSKNTPPIKFNMLSTLFVLSTFISLVNLKEIGNNGCYSGWYPFQDNCYMITAIKGTWQQNREHCSRNGGTMVKIESQSTHDFLSNLFPSGAKFWLGAKYNESGKHYFWHEATRFGKLGFNCPINKSFANLLAPPTNQTQTNENSVNGSSSSSSSSTTTTTTPPVVVVSAAQNSSVLSNTTFTTFTLENETISVNKSTTDMCCIIFHQTLLGSVWLNSNCDTANYASFLCSRFRPRRPLPRIASPIFPSNITTQFETWKLKYKQRLIQKIVSCIVDET
jgi:Lectin C-type domain